MSTTHIPPAPTSNERYIIVTGGDGYATVTVEGRETMEQAFVRAHWPSVNFDQPLSEEEQQTYDFVRDEDQWECDLRNGRECLTVSYEDGWVNVYRITDTLAWAKGPSGHETSVEAATLRTMTTAICEAQDLLECAQPADHLEASTPDDWYAEREAWMKRNTLSENGKSPLSTDETQRVLGAASHEPMSPATALDRFSRRHDVKVTDEQIKHMVNRFLRWRLPENFQPDAGISFKPTFNDHTPFGPQKYNPTGTNLFDASQAEAMVRYLVEGMPCSGQSEKS